MLSIYGGDDDGDDDDDDQVDEHYRSSQCQHALSRVKEVMIIMRSSMFLVPLLIASQVCCHTRLDACLVECALTAHTLAIASSMAFLPWPWLKPYIAIMTLSTEAF